MAGRGGQSRTRPTVGPWGLAGVIWILALLVWILLARATEAAAPRIQSALVADARTALDAHGLPLTSVAFDGRDAVLSGALAAPEVFERAHPVLEGIPGVRSVRRSTAPETAASVRVEVRNGQVLLEGRIPSQREREILEGAASEEAGTRRVVERLVVEPGVDRPDWMDRIGAVVAALGAAGAGTVRLERDVVTVRSAVATPEARNSLVGSIRAAFPDLDVVEDVAVSGEGSEVQRAVDRAVNGRAVAFDRSGTTPTATGAAVLDDLARVLVQHPGARLDILVHRAQGGQGAAGPGGTRDRAERIRDYLVRRGVRSDRIHLADGGSDPAGTGPAVEFRVGY